MRKYSLLFCLVSSLAVTLAPACGDDDDDGDDDDTSAVDADTTGTPDAAAGTPDAPAVSPITDEYLDESCSAATDCGGLLESGDYACLVLDAADALGICASKCTENTDCMDNFTPPAGSSTACALSVAPDTYCAIVCATPGSVTECPTGMTCTMLTGGSICYANQT
jgi:hypothetical protein